MGECFLIGEGTLLGEIVLHATALSLRSNAAVLGAALLTLALPSAGVFEGLLSKRISPRSCALTNGNILQLGGLMLVDSLWCDGRERRTKFSSACAFAHGRWEFYPVSLGNEKISYYDTSDIIVKSILFVLT